MSTPMQARGTLAAEADLEDWAYEALAGRKGAFVLDGRQYEVAKPADVPGYEDEPRAVLLRRKPAGGGEGGGIVFEVSVHIALDEAIDFEPEPPVLAAEGSAS
jgi:hypothetical protein